MGWGSVVEDTRAGGHVGQGHYIRGTEAQRLGGPEEGGGGPPQGGRGWGRGFAAPSSLDVFPTANR